MIRISIRISKCNFGCIKSRIEWINFYFSIQEVIVREATAVTEIAINNSILIISMSGQILMQYPLYLLSIFRLVYLHDWLSAKHTFRRPNYTNVVWDYAVNEEHQINLLQCFRLCKGYDLSNGYVDKIGLLA